jgi:hypothetical protein
MNTLILELRRILCQNKALDINFLLDLEIISKLTKLLDLNEPSLSMNIMCCMANLAGSSNKAATGLIKLGIHKKVLEMDIKSVRHMYD